MFHGDRTQLQWELYDRPLYSSHLAPSEFHQFTKLKAFFVGTAMEVTKN